MKQITKVQIRQKTDFLKRLVELRKNKKMQ